VTTPAWPPATVVLRTFRQKLCGMLGKPATETAWVFPGTPAVHTFFMRYPIDILFLDKDGTVLRAVYGLKPWRLSPVVWRAHWVVEAPAGQLAAWRVGDRVALERLARPTSRRGQALVEFALILPLFILLTLGGLSLFLLADAASTVGQAAQAGANAVAAGANAGDLNQVVCQDLANGLAVNAQTATYTVTVGSASPVGFSCNPAQPVPDPTLSWALQLFSVNVTVTVDLPYTPVFPLPGVSGSLTLSKSATATIPGLLPLFGPGNGNGGGNGNGHGQGDQGQGVPGWWINLWQRLSQAGFGGNGQPAESGNP
jgi:Flp pilus assembly protein TadG